MKNTKMKNTIIFNLIPAIFTLNLLRGLHTNKNKNSSSDITPIVSFDNADSQKVEIFKEIKGKVGIYR